MRPWRPISPPCAATCGLPRGSPWRRPHGEHGRRRGDRGRSARSGRGRSAGGRGGGHRCARTSCVGAAPRHGHTCADHHAAGWRGRQCRLLGGAFGVPGRPAARPGRGGVRGLAPGGAAAGGVGALLRVDEDVPTGTVVALVDSSAERTFLTDSGAVLRLSPATGRLRCSTVRPGSICPAISSSGRRAGRRRYSRCGRPGGGGPGQCGPRFGRIPRRAGSRGVPRSGRGNRSAAAERGRGPGADRPAGSRDAAAELSRHVGRVAVTLGDRGVLLASGGTVTARVPARPAGAAVDSTGAGDAFTGGFLAALVAGAADVTAAEAGCRAGAEAVATVGGRPV